MTHSELREWHDKPWRFDESPPCMDDRDGNALQRVMQEDLHTLQGQHRNPLLPRAPEHDAPEWLHRAWQLLATEGIIDDEEQGPEIVLQTWYVDHERIRRNERPRMIALQDDFTTWRQEICHLWHDKILQRYPVEFFMVLPDPPRSTLQRFHAHLLIRQRAQDEATVLFTCQCQGGRYDAQVQWLLHVLEIGTLFSVSLSSALTVSRGFVISSLVEFPYISMSHLYQSLTA